MMIAQARADRALAAIDTANRRRLVRRLAPWAMNHEHAAAVSGSQLKNFGAQFRKASDNRVHSSFGLICPHLLNCSRRPPLFDDLTGRFVWATETPSITMSLCPLESGGKVPPWKLRTAEGECYGHYVTKGQGPGGAVTGALWGLVRRSILDCRTSLV
jgi:hypothetical protein